MTGTIFSTHSKFASLSKALIHDDHAIMCHKGNVCDIDLPIDVPKENYESFFGETGEVSKAELADIVSLRTLK